MSLGLSILRKEVDDEVTHTPSPKDHFQICCEMLRSSDTETRALTVDSSEGIRDAIHLIATPTGSDENICRFCFGNKFFN